MGTSIYYMHLWVGTCGDQRTLSECLRVSFSGITTLPTELSPKTLEVPLCPLNHLLLRKSICSLE